MSMDGDTKVSITFTYVNDNQTIKASSVQICGSFDKWQVRHPLTYDPLYNKWSVTLKIRKGTHYYKYIVDGEWVVSKGEKTIKDQSGFLNNFISI
jgi:hypothetical protein